MKIKRINILIFCGSDNMSGLLKTIDSISKSNVDEVKILVKLPTKNSQNIFNNIAKNSYHNLPITILREEDHSPGAAINQLLAASDLEFFQIIPAGDTVSPLFYDELAKILKSDIDFIWTGSIIMNSNTTGIYQNSLNFTSDLLNGLISGHLSSIIIASRIVNELKFSAEYHYADDIDFLLNISGRVQKKIRIDSIFTIAEIPGRSANELIAGLELYKIFTKNNKIKIGMRLAMLKVLKASLRPSFKFIKKTING
jgi:hypothetical protein